MLRTLILRVSIAPRGVQADGTAGSLMSGRKIGWFGDGRLVPLERPSPVDQISIAASANAVWRQVRNVDLATDVSKETAVVGE